MEPNSLQYMRSNSFTHNSSTLRDSSFSSYLKPTHIRDSELSIFDAQKYFNETTTTINTPTTPPKLDPKEIRKSVSSIEERARLSSVSSVTDGYSRNNNYRIRSFHATPTASSEASWNSQTGLLSKPPGSITVSLKNVIPTDNTNIDDPRQRKGIPSGKKRFFIPKCPCSGRKSVQVCEKKIPEHNSNTNNHRKSELAASVKRNSDEISKERKEKIVPKPLVSSYVPSNTVHKSTVYSTRGGTGGDGFSFPILKIHVEDPPRDSLEVFQPSDEPISNKSSDIVRDGRPASYGFGYAGSPISRVTCKDDDVASDASSDLFEIESFSTQTTTTNSYPMYLRRESLDEATTFNNNIRRLAAVSSTGGGGGYIPAVTPPELYEPSEASIDWSVTTAEGFDRASITNFSSVSGYEWPEKEYGGDGGGGNRNNGGGGWGMMVNRKGNCGLLSCRHEKAVNVGPNPVRCGAEELPYGPYPLISSSSTTRHVSGRVCNSTKMQPSFVSTSHSARLSLPFAPTPI